MYKMSLFFGLLFLSHLVYAIDIKPEQLQFAFMTTSGREYVSCTAASGAQPHQFKVEIKL